MRPLVEGRRRQARVVRSAGNGCHSATEAVVVHDDAAIVPAMNVVGADEPAVVLGDGEQLEPDLDGAIGHARWVYIDGQRRILPVANAQCFDVIEAADVCALVQRVHALVGGIAEIHFKDRRGRGRAGRRRAGRRQRRRWRRW
eukprot:scaffold1038_cov49-Phaeocystis_antarctica.AAC.1